MPEDLVPCPSCGQPIRAEAIVCRHCKARLDGAGPAPRPKGGGVPIALILLLAGGGVVLAAAVVAAIALPAIAKGMCAQRQAAAERLIDTLAQAARNYELDQNQYPPGDGSGSASLVRALSMSGPRRLPYFEFSPGLTDAANHIINPVRPGEEILYYRNHAVNWPGNAGDPRAHNKTSFDLWGLDCRRRADGINNWE